MEKDGIATSSDTSIEKEGFTVKVGSTLTYLKIIIE